MEKLFLDVSTYLHTSKNHVCLLRTKTTTYDTYASVYTFTQLVKVKVIGILFGDFQSFFFALLYTLPYLSFLLQKTGFEINGKRYLKHE